ncbi:MAG: fibrobacter succinogenes major paralogous domain-containing protein [Bacteroidales bacterium]|nr:fibrobacter succinogenes major paralogous domain-containing protein [Bacteroidales bacterium]
MKKVTTLLRGFFLLVCCLAIASLATAQTNWGGWCYRDYSSNGTFTVPANCTQLYIEAIGAGGGGGNAVAPSILTPNHTSTGTGGGGGAYARKHVTNPSGNYTITIGVGGGPAAAGGATTVTGTGCSITAGGGQPGQSDIHGTGSTGTGGSGGSASGGDANHSGGRGGKVCDNRDSEAGSLHDRVGSGAGGGAAGGNGNGGYQDQPTNDHANSTNTVGAGGGGSVHGLSNNYSSVSTWYKGGNGGAGKDGGSGWGNGDTGGYPGGGGSGARTKGYQGDKSGGRGANGFVRVWFYTEKSEPLTVSIENQSTTCPYTLKATTSNYLFTNTLQWNTGATGSTLANLSPSSNTTYSATVTDKHNYASHTCQITSTASIEVNKCQDCGVTIASATASASEVCVGGPSFLSATLESVDPNASYAWSVNNYDASTNTSLSNYLVTPTSTTTYAIKVTITKGTCTASDTRNIKITVNEKVDPTFASLFNDGYCASTLPAVDDLPTTSDNSITGTWAYSTSDSTYTFTPGSDQCANNFTKKVTISDDPTPGNIEPDIVVCDNQTIYTFNNATSAAGGINGSYAWQVSLDQNTWAPIPNANSAQYAPMTDLTAMATLLDANATGTFYFRRAWTNDCEDVYSNVLSLDNPGTLASGAITADGNQAGEYCADATVTATLTANPEATVASPSFTYQWQSSTDGTTWTNISGATASSYNVSLNPVQKISYRYQVKYSTCDWMTSNNTYDITVKEIPDVKINNVNEASVLLCAGGSVEVTASGADSYKWSGSGSTANPATISVAGTYIVTGTASNGCRDTAKVTVTEKALPTVKINGESAYTLEKCAGATVELTATGAVDYTWSPADGLTITDAEHGSTATLTGTGNYTVTGVDANGCSNTATAAITESALPVVNSITAPTDLCPGKTSYELQADITSSAAIDTYTWGGNATGNTATGTVTATLPNCGQTYNYSLKVKDVKGCESAVKTGSFTTTTPTMTIGTISSMEAVKSAENCKYYVPSQDDLNAAVNSAITSTTCGNTVTLSNINPAAGSLIDATTTVTATATDMCGNTETVSIEVTVPTVTFSIDPTTETFTLPYGAATMDVTLTSTPSFEPSDLPYTFENNLQNPLGVGTHNITWTLKDECGNPITTAVEEVNVVLPECENAVTLDGYDYPVVRVGYDCWFKENVKATTDIADVVAYKNDPDTYKDKFGMLYTWHAAVAAEPETGSEEGGSGSGPALMMPMPIPPVNPSERTQGICPEGWAIPTVEDFQRLFVAAGSNVAYLKDLDATTWTTGKCGIEPSTGFDLRGAGYYLSSIAAFQDLLSNTRFWTDKAGSTANKATCCEFNYYCDEPMFKEISSFDKVSVRCIKINTDLPTPPPTTECPSLGTTVIEIINPVVTGYGELVSATYKATTEIIDYDASKIQSGYYLINAYDGGTPVELEVTGTVSENGLVAELPFNEVVFFNDYTGLTITPVLIVTCENAGGEEMLGEPLTFSDDCPEYTFYNYVRTAPEGIDAHALINHYDVNAIDPNQINWTISSDVATDAPYSFMSSNNTDMDAEYVHIAEIYESNSDRSIQDGLISMNIIHENFPNATTLTFVPSMVVTCDNETRTVIGFPITINLPTYDYTCPTVSSHEFEITLVDGNYTGEIQFEGTNEGTSVSGEYYISPYNQTYGPSKFIMNGDMYNITADNKIMVHIPVNAQGLPGELSEGQSLTVIITIDHGECAGAQVIGTYEAPAAPVECPTITDDAFELEKVNSNYYAVIDYEGGSGNETVSGSYHTSSDDEEIDLQLNETLWLDKTEHTITVTIPFANVELEEGDYLYVSLTLSDQGCEDIVMSGEYFEEPEEEPVPECPNTEYPELDLEKGNSYYVQIPYTGGSGNETVSGVYFIGEVMGETNNPLNNQSLVLDKTDKTITVSIPFTEVTLNPGQTLGVVLTLSDDNCDGVTIYSQYTEPTVSVECPSMGASNLPETITLSDLTITTPVTDLADLSVVTSYGYHIVADVNMPNADPIAYEITVDQATTQVNVQLTTSQLSISADLLGLVPAEYQNLLPLMLQSGYASVSITPFIKVSDTSCGVNGEITGETIVYLEL